MHDRNANRPLRFGVVTPPRTDIRAWRDDVRRMADTGFSTLLMPDIRMLPAPGPTLAVAATLTDTRVGTWVYASPYRPPWSVAWEAHSLSLLTDGRFEFGIGTGRPGIEDELRELGDDAAPPRQRVDDVREAVRSLRELDGENVRTPVAMAVRGPKARAVAAELADIVTIVGLPADSRAVVGELAASFSGADVELALHVPVVGDVVEPFMTGPDTDPAALHAADSLLALPVDPAAAGEEILRRRAEYGFTYFVIGSLAAEALAPVDAELTGK